MIKEKDVIRMKVPYPNISSDLAVQAHMYVCKGKEDLRYEYVKCQSLKPYMLMKNILQHYVDEMPDLARNPFAHSTRIDCDKVFVSQSVEYDDKMKTITRPDVCEELFEEILQELSADGYRVIQTNENQFAGINPLIRVVSSD